MESGTNRSPVVYLSRVRPFFASFRDYSQEVPAQRELLAWMEKSAQLDFLARLREREGLVVSEVSVWSAARNGFLSLLPP